MKYFATATLALALLGAAASAQADTPPDKDHPAHPPAPAAPPAGGAHAPAPGGAHGAPAFHGAPWPGAGAPRFSGAPAVGGPRGGPGPGAASAGRGFQNHALRPSDRGRSAYSASAVPRVFTPQRRFHFAGGGYPGGWYARTWGYGDYLPVGWFTPDFYLDFGYYGLPEPPVGCEWVREGPDAVLVDVWTGEVLSVDSGIFY